MAAAFGIACLVASGVQAGAATSTVVVGATVLSSTTLDTTGCASGVAGRTDFGSLQASALAVTTTDCSIVFGSSNNTSSLRINQSDGSGAAMSQPSRGTLDTSFDGDGHVATATAPTTGDDNAAAVVAQPDGKLVSAGSCQMGGATGTDGCLARFNANGSLDTSFDTDGRVTTAIAPAAGSDAFNAMAIQPDGKFVATGRCDMAGATGADMCLARYDSTGSLDTSFDTDGRVTTATAPGTGWDAGYAIALQVDGKIVVAGYCDMAGATGNDACATRYNVDGSLDTSFDDDGRVTTAIAPGAGLDLMYAVAVQADGKIVLAGQCTLGGATGTDACLVRYNADGSLDTGFDTDGLVTTATAPGANWDSASGLAIQADGKLVAAGACDMGGATGWDFCVIRYNSNGSLDTSFDGDGRVTTAIAPGVDDDTATTILMQPDGRIVAGGYCSMGGATGYDVCLARYMANGTLDTSFDTDGRATAAGAPGANDDYAYTVVQFDGRLVTGGDCDMGATGYDACLTVFDDAGTMGQYQNTVSDWDTAGTGMFGACLRSTSGTAIWTANATCPTTDGAYWNAVPATATTIATAATTVVNATAALRFGIRVAPTLTPGAFVAPLTFTVTAP